MIYRYFVISFCDLFSFVSALELNSERFSVETLDLDNEESLKFAQLNDNLFEPVFFNCPSCRRTYRYKRSLERHLKFECGVEPKFVCDFCPYKCKQKANLEKHMNCRHYGIKSNQFSASLDSFTQH